jgi:anti-anti-sigma factor
MEIKKTVSGTSWELMFFGRLDGALANQMEVEVLAAIRAGATEIYINLSQTEWICSAGIRVLLQYYRQMKSKGGKLLVTRPSPSVDSILDMTGYRNLIVEGAQPPA